MTVSKTWAPGPAAWRDDLAPLPRAEWSYDRAAHLLAHAGFGGTPEEIQALADLGLTQRRWPSVFDRWRRRAPP